MRVAEGRGRERLAGLARRTRVVPRWRVKAEVSPGQTRERVEGAEGPGGGEGEAGVGEVGSST